MSGETFIVRPDNARDRFSVAWRRACEYLQFGKTVRLRLDECRPTRTLGQNAKMWAVLTDIARQVQWPVDGKMQYIEPEDWKDIITAGVKKSQRVAAGIEGGFVMLGQRTSRMSIGQMVEVIEFALWFGGERNVVWSDLEGDTTDTSKAMSARAA